MMFRKKYRRLLVALSCLLSLALLVGAHTIRHDKAVSFFLGRMGQEPRRIGAIMPSSAGTASTMACAALQAVSRGDFVVELGPGTGCVTRALLDQGVAPDKLICVELDPELHQYMAEQFPDLQIIQGDAAQLKSILRTEHGSVGAIVSGIPMVNLPTEKREEILRACCEVLKPHGKMVQFTYSIRPITTIPGLKRAFVDFVLWNMPPAFIWSLTKEEAFASQSPPVD